MYAFCISPFDCLSVIGEWRDLGEHQKSAFLHVLDKVSEVNLLEVGLMYSRTCSENNGGRTTRNCRLKGKFSGILI